MTSYRNLLIGVPCADLFFMFSHNGETGSPRSLPNRNELPSETKWKLEDLYENDTAWEADLETCKERSGRIASFEGTLGTSPQRLLEWFEFADALYVVFERLGNYALRRFDEDTTDVRYQSMRSRVMTLAVELETAASWATPEILSLSDHTITAFLNGDEKMRIYRHALENIIRVKPHICGKDVEQALALSQDATNAPGLIFSMFNDADIRFPAIKDEEGNEVEVTKGRYIQLQESTNRRVREDSFHTLYGEYAKWGNTLAAALSGQVKRSSFYAKARSYENSRSAALDSDMIPLDVYDNVVASINANLQPLHRSIALRKKLLGYDSIRPWDLFVSPVSQSPKQFTYDAARTIVLESVAPMGEEYQSVVREAFQSGWVDVYENRGKRSGAYSAWTYGCHPYILLNYAGTLKDLFTLAHEMGHSMHSWMTWKNQPPVYGGYSIFCAEVASTCNEILLVDYLLKTVDDTTFRKELLLHYIETIRGTVYNQALFAEFEKTIHETSESGGALTADYLNELMRGLYDRYYGADFETHELLAVNWSRIPHFYRSFYVFQYATGLSAAAVLARSILDAAPGAVDAYLSFLKAGSSDYSIALLQRAGVDMTSPKPITAVAELMDSLIDSFEALG